MKIKRTIIAITGIISFLLSIPLQPLQTGAVTREYGVDLAYGRRVVSSEHTDDHNNTKAVDANRNTRYAAINNNDAFFYVDLGSVEKIGKVIIDWEAAYASSYELQLSLNAIDWTTVATVNKTNSDQDFIEFPSFIETQFVQFKGVSRALDYGYSFYSFEVYGPKSLAFGATATASSYENNVELPATAMLDNVANTRWASTVSDNQYVLIDLLESKSFDLIKVRWEVSFARIYRIYTHATTTGETPSHDDAGWTYLTGTEAGLGEVDTFALPVNSASRFIKIALIQRETSEQTKKTGRYPWESTFSIYSFELFDWDTITAMKVGRPLEFSYNSPAWVSMSNITLYDKGLILAPHGYPTAADGVVTNLASMADGNIPGFESYATYNPAVIYDDEREMFHMIYRSELPDNFSKYFNDYGNYEQHHMSTLSYAYSYDGKNFTRGNSNPIAWPTTNDENGGGLEDPRMFKIVNDPAHDGKTTYYITYTMYNYSITREGIIYTHDFITFNKVGRLAPNYQLPHKSGTYVTDPEGNAIKIPDPRPGKRGSVYMIYMKDGSYTRIGFTNNVLNIAPEDIIDIDTGSFGNNHIEALTKGNESCMAITNIYGPDDQDIYLMYGGGVLSDENIQHQQPNAHGWFYALGVLKTTKSNPFELTNVRLDLDEPTMYPTDTNKIDYGLFNKCMFADTMIRHNNEWYFYYGAGDMYVGLAQARADFSAGASSYVIDGTTITASTLALNKRYEVDQSAYSITYVLEIRGSDGSILHSENAPFAIDHFSKLDDGKYSRGEPIQVSVDLDDITGLPSDYYITTYVIDTSGGHTINNPSHYLVVSADISHLPRD